MPLFVTIHDRDAGGDAGKNYSSYKYWNLTTGQTIKNKFN